MKLWLVLAGTLVGLSLTACGATHGRAGMSDLAKTASAGGLSAMVAANREAPLRYFKGDEEDDDQESHTNATNHGDADNDTDNDRADNAKKGYYDPDDGEVLTYGRAPSAAEERELGVLVRRYYAAAAAFDGAAACSMLKPTLADSLPEDYGRAPGPAYLRGSKTCAAVLSRLFEHTHREVPSAPYVTGVRIRGDEALVVLGSRIAPASFVILQREGSTWKIANLLADPLP